MTEKMKPEFYNKLPMDKIKINWNKKPISMSLFLSFLTVDVVRSVDHLGCDTGWTLLENKELRLRIGGGLVSGVEFLDSLQYGTKLGNPYNDYVNPFYLFEILNEEGRRFFLNYYAEDIDEILASVQSSIKSLETQLLYKRGLADEITSEIKSLINSATSPKHPLLITKQPTNQ